MSPGNPFPVSANLDVVYGDSTHTVDSNVFPPEVNKLVTHGIGRQKIWIKCDGNGKMDFVYLKDPVEEIRRLGKLRDDGLLTNEKFEELSDVLLDRI